MAGKRENVGGLEVDAGINLAQLEKGMDAMFAKLKALEAPLGKTEKGLGGVEKGGNAAAGGIRKVVDGAAAMNIALGIAGVNSIQAVIMKMVNLTRESLNLAIGLTAVERQARSIFQDAFPKMVAATEKLALTFRRSSSDVLKFTAGFGDFLEQLGASPKATESMSLALAELTLQFGKLKPNIPDDQIFEALQAGLAGNYKALRQLDVLVKEDALSQFALGKSIKLKVKDMDDEQKATLVTLYLQDQMVKKQDQLKDATGDLGDELKSASAEWQDFKEAFGQALGPAFAATIRNALEMLQGLVAMIKIATGAAQTMFAIVTNAVAAVADPGKFGFFGKNTFNDQTQALNAGANLDVQNQQSLAAAEARRAATGSGRAQSGAAFDPMDVFKRAPRGSGAGGADERKKIAEEVQKLEEDILKTYGEQSKAKLDMLTDERENLMIKKEIGTITKDEERRLDTINRRLAFKNDLLDESIRSWREEVDALKDVEDQIKKINESIASENKKLADRITEIRADAKDDAIGKAEELIREINKIRAESGGISSGTGLSSGDSFRVGQLQSQLQGFSSDVQDEASRRSGLTDQQKIDEDANKRIEQAKAESAEKIKGLQEELAQAEKNKQDIVRMEEEKRNAVVTALAQRQIATQATYAQIDKDTTAHVNTQIAEFNRLQAALRQSAPVNPVGKFAAGGLITGAGGPTDDRIPILASHGERITNAAASKRFGPLLEAINRFGAEVPRFAEGGVVTHHNERTVHQVNHFNGGGSHHQSAVVARWQARRIIL